ncbi:phosphodiester glycosidase family protein [Brevibacillus humidisoli]|uniref:phosphodiester glycosidase family protein n=1 Tax=Brevibacillus humidisoli TaxID=2895522 RepID=UPI001E62CA92|nr:phosphodiester glycosidase family protein [Brevibacillus humidisoli]UFJ40178.1 phosphodiester glycosidase family protein [Brevibacillus humidisoli]
MRRRLHRLLSLLTASVLALGTVVPTASLAAEAQGKTGPLTEQWSSPIGEGTTLYKYTKTHGNKQAVVHVTKVDLRNQYVEVKPVYGTGGLLTDKQNVTQMANESGAIAAINADFFDMSKRGAPFGIVLKDKQLISSMGHIGYWYSLGITEDKVAHIEHLGFSGKVTAENGASFPLRGVNKEKYNPSEGYSHLDQLNLYTPAFGRTSLGKIENYQNVVEVVFQDGVATEVRVDQPGTPIPVDGFVLWGQGSAANYLLQNVPVGSRVTVDYETTPTDKDWLQAVGGHVLLVDQGKALTSFRADDYVKGVNAHSAVGISQDGKTLYMVAVEDSANSRGVSLQELAQILVELGAWRAVNFDGGGSTTLAARRLFDTQATLINQPKGGSQRRVPTGLAVFNTAPPGTLSNFQIYGPSEVLIGQQVEFTTKAYDNHYLPYTIKPSEIRWDVPATDAGTFEGSKFTAKKAGNLTLRATAVGVTKTKEVYVITGKDVAELRIVPSAVNVALGQTVPLQVQVKTKRGQTITASPKSVNVTVNSPLATVDDQLRLTAGSTPGHTTLTVSYDGVSKTVPINIGERELPWLTFDNLSGPYHSGHPASLNNAGSFTLSGEGEPLYRTRKAGRLQYNFAGVPNDDVRISYGRLGSEAVTIPGEPFGMGLWVYGDSSGHWLRAEVIDAKGDLHYVDLAEKVDWTGWRQVRGYFPPGAPHPLKLRSIYLVNKPEETETRPERGTVYFDEVSLLYPYDAKQQVTGREVQPDTPGTLSLGKELNLTYSFQSAAAFLETGRIGVQSVVKRQLPGYVPADYSFSIEAVTYKQGQNDQLTMHPVTVKLTPKEWIKRKGIGLLYVNEQTNTLDPLLGQMDPDGNWVYQLNAYGTYIPYYLDIPSNLPFMDIVNHPAQAEITTMYNQGYVKGLTADAFGPEVALTRAQYVTLLARVYGWKLPEKPNPGFKDAIPAYAQGAVQAAVAKGLVKGYPDKTFRSDQPVSRAEAAVILDRLIGTKPSTTVQLADQDSWPDWAAVSIRNVVGLGLIDPLNEKFEAGQPTTRAVYVVALYRLLNET